eukprot:135487_1
MSLFDSVCRDELYCSQIINNKPTTYNSVNISTIPSPQFDAFLLTLKSKSTCKNKFIWAIITLITLIIFIALIIIFARRVSTKTNDIIMKNNPQIRVQCNGRHALCAFSSCTLNGECDCWIFNSIFTINTNEIFNETIREITQNECTINNKCKLNEAPICKAILSNKYYVNNKISLVTSAYSWEGYCNRARNSVNCEHGKWAACMSAPCVENNDDPNLALCFCKVMNGSWIDYQWPNKNSNCKYAKNVIISTVSVGFDMKDMPGSEYAMEACTKLHIDV